MSPTINRATQLEYIFNFARTPKQHLDNIEDCVAAVQPLFDIWDANGADAYDLFTQDYYEE